MKPVNAALIAAFILLPFPVQAAMCGARETMSNVLKKRHGESVQVVGIDGKGKMIEVWANLETGTWTFTTTRPGGLFCIVGSGREFDILRAEPEGDAL